MADWLGLCQCTALRADAPYINPKNENTLIGFVVVACSKFLNTLANSHLVCLLLAAAVFNFFSHALDLSHYIAILSFQTTVVCFCVNRVLRNTIY